MEDQLEALKETSVSPRVIANAERLVASLKERDLLDGACICPSEDGATLQWPGRGLFCELYDPAEVIEAFFVTVYDPPSKTEMLRNPSHKTTKTRSVEDTVQCLAVPLSARQ